MRHKRPFAPVPTSTAPGTLDRVAVYERRAEAGCLIFHPADASCAGDPKPTESIQAASSRGHETAA